MLRAQSPRGALGLPLLFSKAVGWGLNSEPKHSFSFGPLSILPALFTVLPSFSTFLHFILNLHKGEIFIITAYTKHL